MCENHRRSRLLKSLRERIEKIDTSSPEALDSAIAQLAARFRRVVAPHEASALSSALNDLDVSWATMSAAARQAAIVAAAERLSIPPQTITRLASVVDNAGRQVIRATKQSMINEGLDVTLAFGEVDERAIRALRQSTAFAVRSEYGVARAAVLERKIGRVVADGLTRGLGRDDLAAAVAKAATSTIAGRSPSYWAVVSSQFTTRARAMGQIAGYAEAGITRYRIVSVLDERTTEVCRFLDGKSFLVEDGLRQIQRMEAAEDIDEAKAVSPWIREQRAGGSTNLVVRNPQTGSSQVLASVDRPGRGTTEAGRYSQRTPDSRLDAAGVGLPPYHALCRTTTVADL